MGNSIFRWQRKASQNTSRQDAQPVISSENGTVQNPVQQASESASTELTENKKSPQFVGSVESLRLGATVGMPKRGLEPPPRVNRTRT